MKYKRLTTEQIEELHSEFIYIDVFSDLSGEGVRSKVNFLDNVSSSHMHLFELAEKEMKLISVKVMNPKIDLRTKEGVGWFKKNWQSDFVDYLTASKAYTKDKNLDKFDLIEQGAVITKGELYQWFDEIIN